MTQTTYKYKNISTWSDCPLPVGENWMLTTRTSGFQWRLLMSPFLTPGRLILCPFLSPSPWSTKDKLPHSVIFFLSKYSYKICHLITIHVLPKKSGTEYTIKCTTFTVNHQWPHLHPIKRHVTGDVKLLHQELVRNRVDTDTLGLASCKQTLPISTVADGHECPTRKHL